jgi:hypothetical protein
VGHGAADAASRDEEAGVVRDHGVRDWEGPPAERSELAGRGREEWPPEEAELDDEAEAADEAGPRLRKCGGT